MGALLVGLQDVVNRTGLALPDGGEPLVLRQHWQNSLPLEAGWALLTPSDEGLDCRAWFVDSDIYNTAEKNNQMLFRLGDVAEFFIVPRAVPEGQYFEFHVSPNNLSLSLRFPGVLNRKRSKEEVHACLFEPAGIRFQAYLADGAWAAHLLVPWAVFGCAARPDAGSVWLHSISRYNYTRPAGEPEYSATPPFTTLNYHSIQEYLPLTL